MPLGPCLELASYGLCGSMLLRLAAVDTGSQQRRVVMALVKLNFTQGGKRREQKEAVILETVALVRLLITLREGRSGGEMLISGGANLCGRASRRWPRRSAWARQICSSAASVEVGLRWATHLFNKTGSFDTCTDAGRWGNVRTARIYIFSALQVQYDQLSPSVERKLHKARQVWINFLATSSMKPHRMSKRSCRG